MKYIWKVLQELFWVHFFGCPYCSDSTKIHLDAALAIELKYFLRRLYLIVHWANKILCYQGHIWDELL